MSYPHSSPSNPGHRLIAVIFFSLVFLPATAISAELPFPLWLEELRAESLRNGISDASVNIAFAEITQPAKHIIENDRTQPEVVQNYANYLNARVTPWRKETGQALMLEHKRLLAAIEQDFAVQARFLVAIWGIETNFGTFVLRESIFNVLATLAYDARRSGFFRAQFMATLSMLDADFPPHHYLKSSWAGALGQPQFMPQSYLRLAVDFDGNGEKDI